MVCGRLVGVGRVPMSGVDGLDEAEFARYLELGRENARIMELAQNHCRHIRFVEHGAGGMLEATTDLPLNMRRVECPVTIGNSIAMRLDHLAFEFYAANCTRCEKRDPTGRLPNLETEVLARQQQNEAEEAKRAEELQTLSAARAARVERRRSLRATADPATASILDDLDVLDPDPALEVDTNARATARRSLTAVAGRAAGRFDTDIIDELFDAVETVGLAELLEPLRHLASQRSEIADRLVTVALESLRRFPSLEAGRCLTDHPDLLDTTAFDDAVMWSVVVLAGAKTPNDHYFSGPFPVVQANDPGSLRVVADLCPDELVARLGRMLPRPTVTGLITGPVHRPQPVSDLDRQAAAGAVEHLASTHLDVALQLLPNMAVSLSVPPEDSYDTGTLGATELAIARIFIEAPVRVARLLEDAGRHSSEETRGGLVGAVWRALNMVDTEYVHRRPEDPVKTPEDAESVIDAAFAFLLARTDESWGYKVAFSAAEAIEGMGRQHSAALADHLDTTLGAFVALTRHRLTKKNSVLTSTAEPDPLADVEAFARRNSLAEAARRLLRAVEVGAKTGPLSVCQTITALIAGERDSNLGIEVVCPLLDTLGEIGRRHGDQPGVLQAILPTLHTYMVDADVGPRAAALRAWTSIGATHSMPSTVADLLPALVADPYIVMIDAVLAAACRLPWPDQEGRRQLAWHAASVMESLDVAEHLETFLMSISALRRHMPDLDALAVLEKEAIARLPHLEWYQATKVTEQPWQPDARIAPELAALWLQLAPRYTFGLRQGDEAAKALNGLLDCGAGLLTVPSADLIDVGAAHSPESHYGSMEYAEVAARAERRTDVVAVLEAALARIPDEPARNSQRALLSLAAAVGRLHVTLDPDAADGTAVRNAVDEVAAAVNTCLGHSGDELGWLRPFTRSAAIRAAIVCTLLDLPIPADITTGLIDITASVPAAEAAPSDPAEQFTTRAQRLRDFATVLQRGERSTGTATHIGIVVTGRLLDAVAHLLDAEAADLSADLAQAKAHRTAAARRAAAVDLSAHRGDDPLLPPARALRAALTAEHNPSAPLDLAAILTAASRLPAPLLFIRSPGHSRGSGPWKPPADPESDSPTVAVALVSIDDKLLTGPAIVDPGLTHTLTLQVQTDPWPTWVERMDAELVSTLDDTELQRPALSWQRHEHTGDPETFEGTGSLHVRYAVPITQKAPPVLVRLMWRGTDEDGNPTSKPLAVAGHREFRVRPYDPTRDATTQYQVFDAYLFSIYETLTTAGIPPKHLQPLARLLNAISRIGLAMTWNKTYRRGQHVSERKFHDDIQAGLLADPTLEGRVERGTAHALGFLDTRHDGITAELKVARGQPVTPESATKYIGQPTQYAAADGVRVSILVILDMSKKILPIGTPENYLFVLGPKQHGMADPHSPSFVVTLVINGNLPVPSSWSRRKTPTTSRA